MAHIAFLLTQSLDSPSGLGRYLPLSSELVRLGHKVEIHALHPDFSSLEETDTEQNGIRIHYAAPMHVIKTGDQKAYYSTGRLLRVTLKATLELTRAALRSGADILHVGKPHPMNSLAGLSGRYLRHKTLYVDCDDYEAASGNFSSPLQRAIVAAFERTLPGRAARVTTNTRFMKRKLESWGVPTDRIVYLPNGVDLSRFPQPSKDDLDALRSQHNLGGKQVVAFIGSLSLPSHPVDLLLDAFAQVYRQLPESILLLVGGGDALDSLQDQAHRLGISGGLRFCGRVQPDQVYLYYHLADVSVDPVLDNEAARGRSPLKLFESWACRTPFVTADAGDRAWLLGSPPAGLLARPGDTGSLASQILSVLQDSHLALELTERGTARLPRFTWRHLAREYHASCLGNI